MFNIGYYFLLLSIATNLLFMIIVNRIKNKTDIHYAFLVALSLMLMWSMGHALLIFVLNITEKAMMSFVYLYHIGVIFGPISFLMIGYIYAHDCYKFRWSHLLLITFPILSFIALLTNQIHHLFYVDFSLYNTNLKMGLFFYLLHNIPSYIFMIWGFGYLVYFTINNSGFFSRQTLSIIVSFLIPFIVNFLTTYKILQLPNYSTPITFTVTLLLLYWAIFKYDFLKLTPIALQTIVDHISDCFIVIDKNYIIKDYNKPFYNIFAKFYPFTRGDSFLKCFESGNTHFNLDKLLNLIEETKNTRNSRYFEYQFKINEFQRYFYIELTPVFLKNKYTGTIILLKDITEHKENLKMLESTQEQLMENARLASLGQLIGGIAHNLNTPIMSIAGFKHALDVLIRELKDSIGNSMVTEADYHQICVEMQDWCDSITPQLTYMSDIITAVRDQAVQFNDNSVVSFTIDNLINRVDILMRYSIKKSHCNLIINSSVDNNTVITGQLNSLIQIINNLIINSIHAYDEQGGNIELNIYKEGSAIIFEVKDYGKGIPANVQEKLFKEMVTSKGKDGTGLGLYMSYATIKAKFGGNITFKSNDEGTSFYVSIPLK